MGAGISIRLLGPTKVTVRRATFLPDFSSGSVLVAGLSRILQ